MRARVLLLGLAALALPLLAACGSGGDEGGAFVEIGMRDNFYTREVTRVDVGQEFVFANVGEAPHNAITLDGDFLTPEVMQPGDEATASLDEPGVYDFYCTFHATVDDGGEAVGMTATVVVGDVEYQAGTADHLPIDPVTQWSGMTRAVPADYPTVQSAVDAAEPGDLVLIGPGTYREQVNVTTPYLTIRGTDRQDVVIDGEFTRPNGINVVAADGVAVENLTVRNATLNGLFFTSLRGYRSSYVTATNNGVYGIYAFDATDGVFEHSYAAGSPDAGFYIGQCDPCRAVITDSVAEWNGLGYSGTNASGELYLVNSVWRDNISGILPNTLDTELLPPFHDVTIVGNHVYANGNHDAPTLPFEWYSWGLGIGLAGGHSSLVARNLVEGNLVAGVAVTPNLSERFWMAHDNTVVDNVVRDSGWYDLALIGPTLGGDCFSRNDAQTSNPPAVQVLASCDAAVRLPAGSNLGITLSEFPARGSQVERRDFPRADDPDYWQTAPVPAAAVQPDLPGGADAEVRPATDAFDNHHADLAANPQAFLAQFDVPTADQFSQEDRQATTTTSEAFTVFGVNILASPLSVYFGLYAYLLPFVLYAAWVALAIWDLARREDLSRNATLAWLAVVFLVPFLGVVAYHAAGRSPLPGWLRGAVVGGGFAAYLLILVVSALVGEVI